MTELKRTLGLWTAAGIGIGAIIGTGIFVLIGVAAGLAGPAVILTFIIAGLTFLTIKINQNQVPLTKERGFF